MKKIIFLFFLIFLPVFSFASLELGVILGNPTGISGKYSNFQAGMGWDLTQSFHLNVDYLFYNLSFSKLPLVFYVGGGGTMIVQSTKEKDAGNDSFRLGLRLPLGIFYQVKAVPLKIFFEVAPAFYLIESTRAGIDWGLGVRYVF